MKNKNLYNNVGVVIVNVLLICIILPPSTICFSVTAKATMSPTTPTTTTTITTPTTTNINPIFFCGTRRFLSLQLYCSHQKYRHHYHHHDICRRQKQQQQSRQYSVSTSVMSLLSSVSGGAQQESEQQITASTQKQKQDTTSTTSTNNNNTNSGKVQQSLVAAYSCIGTWILIKYCKLTPVQASSIQGIIGSTILFSSSSTINPISSISFFCGTFAGMSSHIHTLFDATFIGLICSFIYYIFDSKKIGIGYGGRLGLISYIANIVYSTITWKGLNPFSSILSFIRTSLIAYNSPIIISNVLTLFFIVRTNYQILLSQSNSNSNSTNSNTISTETTGTVSTTKTTTISKSLSVITMYTTIKNVAQIVMTLILLITTLTISKVTSYLSFGITFLLIYYSSLATTLLSKIKSKKNKKDTTSFLFNKVVASSLVGLFGSLIVPLSLPFLSLLSSTSTLSSTIAAPIYLGSFIGMTTLQHYNYYNLFIASTVSTCLYHLNMLNGFGGRLGTIAFIGVNLGI